MATALLLSLALCGSPRIELAPFEPAYDFSRSIPEVTDVLKRPGHDGLGYVSTKMTAKAVVRTEHGCRSVSLNAGYLETTVVVARELTEGSCAREHVLAHEREHLRLYQDNLASIEPRLRALAETAPLPADDTAAGKALGDLALDELASVMPSHEALDSANEYARNRTACGGAILRIVKRYSGR